ncbi:hypothetical protein [Nioella nitratireducens]|uniref:hypothetical protein n=1 Tax=Nioella nitratireducens TaxID=1287720 RepID=UPI0008FD54EF|nr:hypothetical protein [Nioella nitratireducens]
MDRIFSMIVNRVIMRLVHRGVDAGINAASRGNSGPPQTDDPQARAAQRRTTQQARQTMRIARRFTRF